MKARRTMLVASAAVAVLFAIAGCSSTESGTPSGDAGSVVLDRNEYDSEDEKSLSSWGTK